MLIVDSVRKVGPLALIRYLVYFVEVAFGLVVKVQLILSRSEEETLAILAFSPLAQFHRFEKAN